MTIVVGQTQDAHLYRCWLDGKDISRDCFAASEEGEWALCYQRNEESRISRSKKGQFKVKLLRGIVVFMRKDADAGSSTN